MYLNINKDFILLEKNIIGIFNLESIKNTNEYNDLYNFLKEKNNIKDISKRKSKDIYII